MGSVQTSRSQRCEHHHDLYQCSEPQGRRRGKSARQNGIKHIRKIYPVYILTIFFGVCAEAVYAIYKSNFTFNFIWHEIVKIIVNIPVLQSATGMSFFTHAYNGVTWFLSDLFFIYLISLILIFILRKFSKSYFDDLLFLLINAFLIVALAYFFWEN